MRRRDLLALIGAGVAFRPLAARAQLQATPVIGFLNTASAETIPDWMSAFHKGLAASGYVDGRNLRIEYRWADGQNAQLPALAADLVARQVTAIAANYPAVLAARDATSSVPIVFTSAADPVKIGLVASLNRPGGNLTGVHLLGVELDAKRLEFLHQLVDAPASIGVLINPRYPDADLQLRDLQRGAAAIKREIKVAHASTDAEIDLAFSTLTQQGIGALLVASDPFFTGRRGQLVALAARYKLPTIYNQRKYAEDGGLITYGADFADGYYLAGTYVGKILDGARPADLPVQQSTKLELVLNLKTAKALGLTVPQSLLARADEVIE